MHEVCKKGRPENELTWYDGGPPISYFPIPQPDPERPHGGNSCNKCAGTCNGHYLKPDELFQLQSKSNTFVNQIPQRTTANPPSDIILATFKKYKNVPSPEIIQETAKKVLLNTEETKMWFEHLHQISLNEKQLQQESRRKPVRNLQIHQPIPLVIVTSLALLVKW